MGLWLALVTALALLLRLFRLAYWGLWADEGEVYHYAAGSAAQVLSGTATGPHPPGFYLLFHYWKELCASLFLWRLLPALIGALSIPLLFLAGRGLVGTRPALLAALLLAVNPVHVGESQDLRMYSLLTLEYLLLFWAAGKVALEGRKLLWYGLVAAVAALFVYAIRGRRLPLCDCPGGPYLGGAGPDWLRLLLRRS